MKANKAGNAGHFTKGDARINKTGRKSKAACEFGAAFTRALAENRDPKALADMLWDKALKGQSWAADMLLDRLMGKVTQPIVADQDIRFRIIYDDTPEAT